MNVYIRTVVLFKVAFDSTGTEMARSGHRTNPGPTDWQDDVQKGQGLEGARTLPIKQQRGRPRVQAGLGKELSRRGLIRTTI